MSTDPTDPLEAARRANRALSERVADLERQLKRFAPNIETSTSLGGSLAEREALLSEAERIAHMGSWVWNVVNDEVRWSDELYRILGYDPATDSASIASYFARVHPDDRAWVQDRAALGIKSGVSEQLDYRVLRPDGMIRYVKVDGAMLFDAGGNLQRAVGTVLDVTEARESARALKETAQLLAEAQRIGRMGSFSRELAGAAAVWSDELYRILDVDRDVAPAVEVFLQSIHVDDRERIRSLIKRAIETGHVEPSRARVVHRDGKVLHVDLVPTAIRDEHGKLRAIRGTLADVTELVHLEAQFHQSQKMEAVGQLAGGLAHDYNNLLMVICGNAELLMEERDRPELREILSAATSATALTGRLLAFSRQSSHRARPLWLTEQIEEAKGAIERALGDAIEMRLQHGGDLGPVCVDSGQVQQMLLNLALNARDAMPDGGSLTLVTCNQQLTAADAAARGGRAGDYVTVSVSDTGIGMDETTCRRAFEPFFTTKGSGRGTGLGLAMVFGAMKQCGGFMELHSKLGEGATITLWFPRAAEVPLLPPRRAGAATPLRARVLLVEDNVAIGNVVKRILTAAGCSVRSTTDPRAALQMWQKEPADVLITDVEMPGMSGAKLRERLRETHPQLRTLFITGHSSERLDVHVQSGRCAVVMKPFRGDELLLALDKLLCANA